MNNKVFFLVSLMLFSGRLIGQNKLKLGLEAGANYSDIRGKGLAELYDYDFGFLSGLSLEYALNERISLGSGLGYERKTTSFNTLDDPYYQNSQDVIILDARISRAYDYLTLPILIKYYFIKSLNFYVQGGFYTSYLIKTTDKINDTSTEGGFYTDTMDLGVVARFGYSFSIGDNSRLNIQIGNNLGFLADNFSSYNLTVGWNIQL